MENKEHAIRVDRLTKYYGQLIAVDNISFGVQKGELFGFLGPNGAGKTTTVRILTGVTKKDNGEVTVMGYPAGSIAAKQVSGVVPEFTNAYMDLTGWGNLMLVAGLYRVSKTQAAERGINLLRALGLYDRRDSLAKTYSMGMRRRLIVASALLADPEIVFLDEPTSGLDVQSARLVRSHLKELKRRGKTIFLTTHNMTEAAEMCDRVAIINRGILVSIDTPDNLRITAGREYLLDIIFDKPVPNEILLKLPGVSRIEKAHEIEAAEQMRMQSVMMGMRPGRARPGGIPGTGSARGPNMGKDPGDKSGAGGLITGPAGKAAAERSEDNRVRLYTEETEKLIASLVDFSREHSLKMKIMNVRPPSLEDAFVRLIEGADHEK